MVYVVHKIGFISFSLVFLFLVLLTNIFYDRLIGLKNIFARQLPNMPKEYIVRLVMDRLVSSLSSTSFVTLCLNL